MILPTKRCTKIWNHWEFCGTLECYLMVFFYTVLFYRIHISHLSSVEQNWISYSDIPALIFIVRVIEKNVIISSNIYSLYFSACLIRQWKAASLKTIFFSCTTHSYSFRLRVNWLSSNHINFIDFFKVVAVFQQHIKVN